MLVEMPVMKFDVHQLTEAAPFLGSFCFSLFIFIFIVIFICINMFITIISDTFRHARENVKDDRHEIFSFVRNISTLDRYDKRIELDKNHR
jgi:hypothetical protein